ncbi:MAG: NAD-binding protein [Phycisphaerae bacterium]|nr:NAD-binding protein [Gemmatimonadaceae bacterium]
MSDSQSSHQLSLGNRNVRWGITLWFFLTLGLGTYGYYQYDLETAADRDASIRNALYYTVQLFFLQTQSFGRSINVYLELARWFAPLLTGLAFYTFAERVIKLEWGARKLSRIRDHVIVAGLGRKGFEFASHEREQGRKVVVIDRVASQEIADQCREIGAMFVLGDATQEGVLQAAGLSRASALYAVCGEDSTNCEIAAQAGAILKETKGDGSRNGAFRCHVHIGDIDLRDELQQYQQLEQARNGSNVRFFDLFDHDARKLLLEKLPIDHDGISVDSPCRAHLILLGFGRMGRSVAVRAAKVGHFANATRDPSLRLRISVIDRDAVRAREALMFRHPNIELCCDLDFHSFSAESGSARKLVDTWCADVKSLTSVVVCFDDEPRAVEIVTRMLPTFSRHGTRVAVRMAQNTQLSGVGRTIWNNMALASPVRDFGTLREQCRQTSQDDSVMESIARAIHEEYVVRRLAEGQNIEGDRSLPAWASLNESFRESNRQQAHHINIKLRSIGCEIAEQDDPRAAVNPFVGESNELALEVLARMEHDRWCAQRWLDGWTYAAGPKNVQSRTSPYLVPWDALAEPIREYDREAVRAIPTRLREADKKIASKQVAS